MDRITLFGRKVIRCHRTLAATELAAPMRRKKSILAVPSTFTVASSWTHELMSYGGSDPHAKEPRHEWRGSTFICDYGVTKAGCQPELALTEPSIDRIS